MDSPYWFPTVWTLISNPLELWAWNSQNRSAWGGELGWCFLSDETVSWAVAAVYPCWLMITGVILLSWGCQYGNLHQYSSKINDISGFEHSLVALSFCPGAPKARTSARTPQVQPTESGGCDGHGQVTEVMETELDQIQSEITRLQAENASLRQLLKARPRSWKALLEELPNGYDVAPDHLQIQCLKEELCNTVERRRRLEHAVRARHQGLQRAMCSEGRAPGLELSTCLHRVFLLSLLGKMIPGGRNQVLVCALPAIFSVAELCFRARNGRIRCNTRSLGSRAWRNKVGIIYKIKYFKMQESKRRWKTRSVIKTRSGMETKLESASCL